MLYGIVKVARRGGPVQWTGARFADRAFKYTVKCGASSSDTLVERADGRVN